MPRHVLLITIASLVSACVDPTPAPTHGALRIHGVAGQGELYLDAISRGPVQAEQLFEGLAAGVHLVDLRRDGVVAASIPVEVRAGMILDARIEAPPLVAAVHPAAQPTPRAVNVAAAPTQASAAVAELPSAFPPVAAATASPETASTPSRPDTETVDVASRSRSRTRSSTRSGRTPAPAPRGPRDEAEIDTLMEQALERAASTRELAAEVERDQRPATAPTPEELSTSQISSVMQRARGAAAACGGAPGSTVVLDVELSGATGRAVSVGARGRLAGTAAASCVENAVYELLFPRFSRDRQWFSWPIRF